MEQPYEGQSLKELLDSKDVKRNIRRDCKPQRWKTTPKMVLWQSPLGPIMRWNTQKKPLKALKSRVSTHY